MGIAVGVAQRFVAMWEVAWIGGLEVFVAWDQGWLDI